MGRTRDTILEGNNVPARDGTRNLGNSKEGKWRGKGLEEEKGENEELLREHAERACGGPREESWVVNKAERLRRTRELN